jgi:hypothetical protein
MKIRRKREAEVVVLDKDLKAIKPGDSCPYGDGGGL